MTTDPDCPPPPYTPSDPLTPATTQGPDSPLRLREGDGQIPAYSPTPLDAHAVQGLPTVDDVPSPQFSSAAPYFEERGVRNNTVDNVTRHQLFISPADRTEDVAAIPLCWRNRTSDLTQADMTTFANFLLPPSANTRLPPKLRADLASNEKQPMSPTDTESDSERRARMLLVVAEWNDAFFYPRGLLIELVFVPQHPPYTARGLDPICQSCVAANNSASRYAAQGYLQPGLQQMPHGLGVPPPPPLPMFQDPAMFPRGLPPMPHIPTGTSAWPPGLPPQAGYGRGPFGLGYLRDGIERFASGRGWSPGRGRGRGRSRGDFSMGRGAIHPHQHDARDHHRNRRSKSSDSSSSSSSSSNDSGHDHRRGGRHAGRGRGMARGRDCGEPRGRRRHEHSHSHRRRGRSRSASTSSSSSTDSSSTASISSRDVRGLGLQDIIRGLAAAHLDKYGRNAADQSTNEARKSLKHTNKTALKELKTGLKELKRQKKSNVDAAVGGIKGSLFAVGKDEKKAIKRELKDLKKDLKQQCRECKREKKGSRQEERNWNREDRRDGWHGTDNGGGSGRCGGGGRRGRNIIGPEPRDWEQQHGYAGEGQGEGQVSGVTQI